MLTAHDEMVSPNSKLLAARNPGESDPEHGTGRRCVCPQLHGDRARAARLTGRKADAKIMATPLRQVMEEGSRLSGVRVRWLRSQAVEKPVSVEFTALPLPEALQRILGETNFLLFYASVAEGTALTQIGISTKGTGGGQPGPVPQPAALERQAELDAAPVDTLIQTAVSTLDPSGRIEAIARLGGHAPADPKVEDILSHLAAAEILVGLQE